jgi:hypothetical protein
VRKAALSSLGLALLGALAFAFAASGGGNARELDAARTANAPSVHYRVTVTLTQANTPMTLQIAGAAARDKLVAHLSMGLAKASVMRDPHFVYEGAPDGVVAMGGIKWLRLRVDQMPPRAKLFSMLRALTPSPFIHVVSEAKLSRAGAHGIFAGTVAYDDPTVRTALYQLTGGIEFRGLHLRVVVGRDGRLRTFFLTGRTADRQTTLALHARFYGYGTPVRLPLPKPGAFMDPALLQLQA